MLNTSNIPQSLNIYLIGFGSNERRLIDATVRLSQRRSLSLSEVDKVSAHLADIVLIDCQSADADDPILHASWLRKKTVILIDEQDSPLSELDIPRSLQLKRPVQWTNLPQLIMKAFKQNQHNADAAPTEITQQTPAVQQDNTVLVVDDSEPIRTHLASLLSQKGLLTTLAASGEEAIELSRTKRFSCVLMDVIMPGIDGYQACRSIKTQSADTPIVMLTSKSSPFDKIRGKIAGCDDYLTKPTSIVKLFDALGKYIDIDQLATA